MDLDEIRAFLAVAEVGSLSGAARRTGLARSTLRRRLTSLEERIHSPVFFARDGRLELTDRGRVLATRGQELLALAHEIEHTIRGVTEDSLEGPIVAVCQVGVHPLAALVVTQMVTQTRPGVQFDLRFSADPMDELARDGDLAVTLGAELPDGPWIARRVADVAFRLRASETWLSTYGTPRTLDDLAAHRIMLCSAVCAPGRLPLLDGSSVPVDPTLISNDAHCCDHAARSGLALALAPEHVLPGDSEGSQQVRTVLGDIVGVDVPSHIVAPGGLSQRPGVAAVVEEMLGFLQAMGM